jgi:hypothetical protein
MEGRVAALPDDIEQYLIDDRRTRAISALMKRRQIPIDQARELVGQWLFARAQCRPPPDNA